jgi:predicted negative regulator of RcsB-dependent stress response
LIKNKRIKMRNKEDKILNFINKIKKNKKAFFTAAAFVLGVSLFVGFVYYRLQIIKDTASTKLSLAVNYVASGNMDQGLGVIDEIISKYSNTPAAYRAMLMKSNYFISQNKYDEAEQLLKTVIKNAKPDTVKPLGYPGLILVYDNTNKIDKAIEISNEFLTKYKTNYLAASVTENMARLYELSGNEQEAQNIYKKITEIYPGTEYSERAKSKIK